MVFYFVKKWFEPAFNIKNELDLWTSGPGVWAFLMFLTKAGNVIESFLWSRLEILLKNGSLKGD